MNVTKAFLRTAGAVGIALASVTAGAQGLRQESPSTSTTINVADAPSPATTAQHKTAPTVAPAKATAAADGILDMGKVEMVTERYPDGKVKIEREVGQDAAGNYFNQGTFKLYAPSGDVVKAGEFLNGKQQGKWTQQLATDEGHLFSASNDKQWSGPFASEATFQDGRLHGTWTIKDSHGQSIIQWSFDNGTRSGTWTWWHSNGQKRLEAAYVNGALNGEVLEWDRDGKIVNQNAFVDGKCVVKTVGWYTLGQKRYEGTYLRAPNMPQATYDWWNSKIATWASAPAGPDQQHGNWTEWYASGNKKTEAQYDRGVPVGKFTWWYENGQEQAEGEYEAGQKSGTWITWHANGLKESLGEYKAGKLVSKWLHWTADGKLLESHEGQESDTPRVGQRASPTPSNRPQLTRPPQFVR
jgi:antitoxin component YwqK of YwqJK toxin-antitoxin module